MKYLFISLLLVIASFPFYVFIYFKDFIYLFIRDTHREKQRHRQREKQAPCREPDAGLNPRSLGSCPGLKMKSSGS